MKKTLRFFLTLSLCLFFSICFLNKSPAKEIPVYTIQLTNTKSKQEAEHIFNKIRNLEYSRIDKVGTRYKVRIGLFKTRAEAGNYLKKHPEIKKISPSAYITLNYYDPARTIKKGYFPSEVENKKTKVSRIKQKKQPEEKAVPPEKKISPENATEKGKTIATNQKNKEKSNAISLINNPVFRKYLLWITMAIFGTISAIISVMLVRKFNVEKNLRYISKKFQGIYLNTLRHIPLKTSKKILEYHYKKIGDFRSLILMKLQEQDFNFILKETPKYLLKHPDDILVWKIYIEALAQLGIYAEAATACEKLAKILRKNARPEAAENYLKKAKEYRKKAGTKPIENAG